MDPVDNRLFQLQNQINCEKKGAIICASIAAVAAIIAAVALALFLTVPTGAAITPFVAIAAGGAALVLLITAISLLVSNHFKTKELNRLLFISGTNSIIIFKKMDPETAAKINSLQNTCFYQHGDEISDSDLKQKFAISKEVQEAINTDENVRFFLDLLSDDTAIDLTKLSASNTTYFTMFRTMVRGDTASHIAQIFNEETYLTALSLWKQCKRA